MAALFNSLLDAPCDLLGELERAGLPIRKCPLSFLSATERHSSEAGFPTTGPQALPP